MSVSDYSKYVSTDMYPGQSGEHGQRDAARHMLAAGTLARKYGVAPAEFLGKMHEWSTSPLKTLKMMLGQEPTADYIMDTHNNAFGAQLGKQAKSQAELEDLVQLEAERAQLNAPKGKAMIVPADTKSSYAAGGYVEYDPDYVDTLMSRTQNGFADGGQVNVDTNPYDETKIDGMVASLHEEMTNGY